MQQQKIQHEKCITKNITQKIQQENMRQGRIQHRKIKLDNKTQKIQHTCTKKTWTLFTRTFNEG